MDELINYITPILLVALCFIFNRRLSNLTIASGFEAGLRAEHYKAEIDYYKTKLIDFLNPLIICIEFDNSIWHNLSMVSDSEEVFSENLSKEIENNHLLINLSQAKELVRKNLYYVKMDSALYKTLIEFIRHVSIYESIRSSTEPCNPIDVGASFPDELESLVRSEYVGTIDRYEELIKMPNKASNYAPKPLENIKPS